MLTEGPSLGTLDRMIWTTNGYLPRIKLSIYSSLVICNAMINADHNTGIDVIMFHEMMSHCGVDKLQEIADTNGWKQEQDASKEDWKIEMHGPTEKMEFVLFSWV
jgi:hypothetical protein